MNYTTIEQSRKLLELGLNPESADMQYSMLYNRAIDGGGKRLSDIPSLKVCTMSDDVPCWSLAALYNILPNNEKESTTLSRGGWKIAPPEYIDNWWCEYEDERHTKDFTVSADSPIDACYEMILKLHELNLL